MASGISVESPHQIQELSSNNSDAYDIKGKSAVKNAAPNNNKPSRNCNRKFSRQESVNHSNTKVFYGKRRHSFSSLDGKINAKKRVRPVLPTRFLLGGNICDPLNLGSLADEEINKKLNQITPQSSPIPTPKHSAQVEVLIPSNINDPLNLNGGEEDGIQFLPPKPKKRRKHRNKKKSQAKMDLEVMNVELIPAKPEDAPKCDIPLKPSGNNQTGHPPESATARSRGNERMRENMSSKGGDKIVSPVLPQGSPLKFHRRFHSCNLQSSSDMVDVPSTSHGSSKKQKSRKNRKDNKPVSFREKDAQFCYGNFSRYYGYRNKNCKDPRIKCMRREWFEGKDVLDIGCNTGHLTLTLAQDFHPRKIIGLDIDNKLIRIASKNVRHYLMAKLGGGQEFPISLAICYGPIIASEYPWRESEPPKFPNNVFFVQGNYILESDDKLEDQKEEYDMILCLSLTKWVHLNWGDAGLKRLFKRMYLQLRPGGRMLLEAQPWSSYAKKKKLTETIYKNYHAIQMHPEEFNEYLLSKEVGFSTCEFVDMPAHPSSGFMRPLYLFTKSGSSSPHQQEDSSASKKGTVQMEESHTDMQQSSM